MTNDEKMVAKIADVIAENAFCPDSLEIEIAKAVLTALKPVILDCLEVCEECRGSGSVPYVDGSFRGEQTCFMCDGKKVTWKEKI